MESEAIRPPSDNLANKGGPTGRPKRGAEGGPPQQRPPSNVRQGAGGPGVRVFGERGGGAQPGILTGNGSVFIGTKGIMATCNRGEGVWLLPSARWKEYVLPPQLLTRSPGHMLDWIRACKGGDSSCSDFNITGPYAEWLAMISIAYRVPGKLNWAGKGLRFTNSGEATALVPPVFRSGWELKLEAPRTL